MAKKRKAKKNGSKGKTTKKKAASKKKKSHKASPKKKTKKSVVKKGSKRSSKKSAAKKKLPAEPLGRVTHYFPKVRATAIMIKRDRLVVGDVLYFKGHTTNFKQKIESLQINRLPVTQAGGGDEVGIRVKSRTREGDFVFKL